MTIQNSETSGQQEAVRAATILLFPTYSQVDPKWGFEQGTERSTCGVTSVKSVIDYYAHRTGIETPSMQQLVETIKQAHDAKPNGISHAVEVNILKSQGLVAWRRNWAAPSSDTQWLVDNEGYNDEQVAAITLQQSSEHALRTRQERELASITASLEAKDPVIASVKPGFGGNRADHQLVIVARETDERGDHFVVMDPEKAPGSPLHHEPVERFFEYFNDRAIFVKQ